MDALINSQTTDVFIIWAYDWTLYGRKPSAGTSIQWKYLPGKFQNERKALLLLILVLG